MKSERLASAESTGNITNIRARVSRTVCMSTNIQVGIPRSEDSYHGGT